MKNYKQVVSDLRKDANVECVNGCVIKSTALTQRSNGDTVIRVVLNKDVPAYVRNEDGDYVPSKSNIIYVAPFVFAKALEECEDAAFLSDYIIKNPTIVNAVISYAKCDVIGQPVKAGDDYINPFSNKEVATTIENDNIYHHVVNIQLSRMGLNMADRILDKLAMSAIGNLNVTEPKEIIAVA